MNHTYYIHRPGKFKIDDISFSDLDMDRVFSKIDHTVSSVGEEILYSYLRNPCLNVDEIEKREQSISLYTSNETCRNDSRKALKNLSKLKKYSVFEYLFHLDEVECISIFKRYQALILLLIGILLIFINPIIGILATVIIYFYNTFRYFKLKNEISPYYICLSYISKAVKCGQKIPVLNKENLLNVSFLANASFLLGNLSGETIHGGSGNPIDLIIDIIKMGFHIDIIRFYSLIERVRKNQDSFEAFLVELGTIDASISIFELRNSLDYYSVPVFVSDNNIKISMAVHPLLNDCVSNDIETSRSVLITGSNASGKSTFLRTLAINMILAQGINTTFSQGYSAPFFKVVSAMSVKDDLLSGESYYMAEIKALKRILDQRTHSDDILVCSFVDEVLNGTNTIERIAASSCILKYLSSFGICFGATHDLELTSILKDSYTNYHFSEDISSDDIQFSYKLKEGPSQSTNAIKLLGKLDYPNEIIQGALDMVNNFSLTQKW